MTTVLPNHLDVAYNVTFDLLHWRHLAMADCDRHYTIRGACRWTRCMWVALVTDAVSKAESPAPPLFNCTRTVWCRGKF